MKGEVKSNAGLLCEVSYKKGDEERQEHNHEKRQIGDPGCVPGVRDENVPNREDLGKNQSQYEKAGY
jgi:hypothetical protein